MTWCLRLCVLPYQGTGFQKHHIRKVSWQTFIGKYKFIKTRISDILCVRTGFDSVCAAHIFHKLMRRLGFQQFYAHGGDWGWLVTTNMAQLQPK